MNVIDVRKCSLRLQQSTKINKHHQSDHKQFGHSIKFDGTAHSVHFSYEFTPQNNQLNRFKRNTRV